MVFVFHLILYHLVELGPRQWIANANAYIIGHRFADQFDRCHDVGEVLSRVTELDKITGADAGRAQPLAGNRYILDLEALVHSIQYLLAPAFSTQPDFGATCAGQSLYRLLGHEIDSRLNHKRDAGFTSLHFAGKFAHPLRLKPENIIRKPDVVRANRALQHGHLFRNFVGRSHRIALAPDRLRTPVAMKRATAG